MSSHITFAKMDTHFGEQFINKANVVIGSITRNRAATAAFGNEDTVESYSVEINGASREFNVNGRFWSFGAGYRTERNGYATARKAHTAAKDWARTNPGDAA